MRRRFMSFKEGEPIDINNYLTIEALEDGLTAILYGNACEYCVDGDGNWKVLLDNVVTKAIGIGHTLSFRGELTPTSSVGIGYFKISKKCNLLGNCMSMLFGNNAANNFSLTGKDYAFKDLFINCSNIVNISADFLPATTLASSCYESMFSNCTSLTTAPALPATTLEYYCYRTMFSGCTNLTTAPELLAITLVYDCYEHMFLNCSKLNYIKAMFTAIPSISYTSGWVSGVASTGTFVKNPEATWDVVGDSGVPSGWTVKFDGEEDEKIVNKITVTYEETGPEEYEVIFTAQYEPASSIQCSVSYRTVTLTSVFYRGVIQMAPLPTINNTSISPTEDDTYIYELIFA